MKSAYERAMERADKIGKASAEELRQMEAVPTGNQIAARYMKEPGTNLTAELEKFKGSPVRKPVMDGALEILLRYITLPTGSVSKDNISRAKQGILSIKENRKAIEGIFAQIDNLFNYYEQARQHAVSQLRQAIEQQQQMGYQQRGRGGQPGADPAMQPQVREELARVLGDLNRQYEQALDEQKQRILKTP